MKERNPESSAAGPPRFDLSPARGLLIECVVRVVVGRFRWGSRDDRLHYQGRPRSVTWRRSLLRLLSWAPPEEPSNARHEVEKCNHFRPEGVRTPTERSNCRCFSRRRRDWTVPGGLLGEKRPPRIVQDRRSGPQPSSGTPRNKRKPDENSGWDSRADRSGPGWTSRRAGARAVCFVQCVRRRERDCGTRDGCDTGVFPHGCYGSGGDSPIATLDGIVFIVRRSCVDSD
jgi:hypothetical protein